MLIQLVNCHGSRIPSKDGQPSPKKTHTLEQVWNTHLNPHRSVSYVCRRPGVLVYLPPLILLMPPQRHTAVTNATNQQSKHKLLLLVLEDFMWGWDEIAGIAHDCSILTHWDRDEMDAIMQTTFSSALFWKKMFEFRLKFHWRLFLRVKFTIFQHWFR